VTDHQRTRSQEAGWYSPQNLGGVGGIRRWRAHRKKEKRTKYDEEPRSRFRRRAKERSCELEAGWYRKSGHPRAGQDGAMVGAHVSQMGT
jgi:hypothetical protein